MLLLFYEQLCLNYGYVYSLASLFCGYQPVNVQIKYRCYNISIFAEFYAVYSYWLARCLAISQWANILYAAVIFSTIVSQLWLCIFTGYSLLCGYQPV